MLSSSSVFVVLSKFGLCLNMVLRFEVRWWDSSPALSIGPLWVMYFALMTVVLISGLPYLSWCQRCPLVLLKAAGQKPDEAGLYSSDSNRFFSWHMNIQGRRAVFDRTARFSPPITHALRQPGKWWFYQNLGCV